MSLPETLKMDQIFPIIRMDSASKCKLPEIQLPTFDGNPREWLNFWTLFQKMHEETSIYDRDKYQYLFQSTVPGSAPREIVESFPATAENYKKAVEYLKERFGEENVSIQVCICDLLLQLVISKIVNYPHYMINFRPEFGRWIL
ncbi:hypothetical protein AVEN_76240-1 [Araneus ventricosus]|uniref:Uncharacterized protein n=1 Tax=Araneus ventricosus TaxID=182803 RepID=A0A4Y2W0T7_ARAVE|nr:hypothetical protein AVEN_76240-1 [Araneus ventricosus]